MRTIAACAALLCLITGTTIAQTTQRAQAKRWYKGNLHTHTVNSDGDSTPEEVTAWYREHGYNFLVLSDHNKITDVSGLNATQGANGSFLLITGEEVSDQYGGKPLHMNAYNPDRLVAPQHGDSVASTIQNNVNEIKRANGVPSVNHPNFHWAITIKDLLAVKGLGLFEVYNGHPMVNNQGGGGFPSLDAMWDALLTAGQRLYGIAVDDAHHFKKFGKEHSNPGHGWVQVHSQALTAPAILRAIEAGEFYASTGVNLRSVDITPTEYRIEIAPTEQWEEKTTTYFIGPRGSILAKSVDRVAVYRRTGKERYVRARVESSSGAMAWTQPVFAPARKQ